MKKHVFYFNLLKMQAMKGMKIWLVMVGLVFAVGVCGQGWMKIYGESEPLGAASLSNFPKLVRTSDGNYLIMGLKYASDGFSPDSVVLIKAGVEGELIWRKTLHQINAWYPTDIVQVPSGGFIIGGYKAIIFSEPVKYVLERLNENGDVLWQQFYQTSDIPDDLVSSAVTNTTNGGFLLVGQGNSSTGSLKGVVVKTNSDGDLIWAKTYSPLGTGNDRFEDVEPINGGYIITGYHYTGSPQIGRSLLLKIDENGNTTFINEGQNFNSGSAEKVIPVSNGDFFVGGPYLARYSSSGIKLWDKPSSFHITDAVSLEDGGFLLSGGIASSDVMLQKINSDGQDIWTRHYGSSFVQEKAGSLLIEQNGSVIISGHRFDEEGKKAGLLLLKTDSLGNLYTSALSGTLHQDPQSDCQPDPNELGLSGWLVQATGAQSFATLTDSLGHFILPIDTGSYEVTVAPPSPYWEVCNSPTTASITAFYDTLSLDFPAQAISDCPYLTVDISAPFLRRCFDNSYYVHYCNDGTASANDATVEVTLDPYFTYVSSTLPLASQNGNTLTFNLGEVAAGDCGSFYITTYLGCDETVLGQTHCTSAHITPDSLCLPPDPIWDGSSIEVDASCDGDSIIFTITNVGSEGMPAPLSFIIIEDQIVLLTDEFQLGPGSPRPSPCPPTEVPSTWKHSRPRGTPVATPAPGPPSRAAAAG